MPGSRKSGPPGRGSQRGPSQRQLRVGEVIRHTLSDILARGDVHDTALAGRSVTITEAQITGDLKQGIIYVTPLAVSAAESKLVIEGLNRCAPYLRGQLSNMIEIRHTPALKFILDERFDKADALDRLLRDPKVAKDLQSGKQSEEDA